MCNYRLFDKITVLKYHCINLECFYEFVSAHPCFLAPLLAAQQHLQSTVLGERAWNLKTSCRHCYKNHIGLANLRKILLGTGSHNDTERCTGQDINMEYVEDCDHNDILSAREPKYYVPQQDGSGETSLHLEIGDNVIAEPAATRCFFCL